MSSLDQLPVEMLHHIFRYLDISDIPRMRRVSCYLNEVTRCRDVWSDAYRKAKFICPPGPFLSQSTRDLETALVSSFRVHRNLRHGGGTSGHMNRPTRKLREIHYTGVELRVSLVLGRFLLIAFSEEVCCYDLNRSGSDGSIIYRSAGGTLTSFHCASAFDVESRPFACVVLNEEMETTRRISTYLLSVGEQSEVTLELLHQFKCRAFNIEDVDLGPCVIVIQGRVGCNIITDTRIVAFDVRARTQLLLPSWTPVIWETAEPTEFTDVRLASISTSTHLLLACSFFVLAANEWKIFIQAFVLPRLNTHQPFLSASIPLSLSHCGVISGIHINNPALLHDSVLDPTTQEVLITIRVYPYERFPLDMRYGTLHLSAIHDQNSEVGTITFHLQGLLSCHGRPLHPSLNGTGRVYQSIFSVSAWAVEVLEYDLRARSGDDEREAKVIDYHSILWFSTARKLLDYDPYFGRICLRASTAMCNVLEVLDLAV